jgi:hypothetical protein
MPGSKETALPAPRLAQESISADDVAITSLPKSSSPPNRNPEWPQNNFSTHSQSHQGDMDLDLECSSQGRNPVGTQGTWTTVDAEELKYSEDQDVVRQHAMSILVRITGLLISSNIC